jgi:mannose-6-phosphate isomerase-like protein (cupin superfamily)
MDRQRTGVRSRAGDILVIKPERIHGFRAIGDEPLVQVDVHLSPASSRRT